MKIDFNSIGLEDKCLYEILATTYSIQNDNKIPNTACMGIIIEADKIKILPYPETKTYKNLKKNKLITINFVDNTYLYSLAALKLTNLNNDLITSPDKFHKYIEVESVSVPIIKDSWAIIVGRVSNENQIIREDKYGKIEITEFEINPTKLVKFRDSFKLFNRAENLALETIILATRLKIAVEKQMKDNKKEILKKINENIDFIYRIGKNTSALRTIDYVKKYIISLNVNL